MPMAATSRWVAPILYMASCATPIWVDQISMASCSTQPARGKCWVYSFCARETIFPSRSNKMQRELVVPWSSAMM